MKTPELILLQLKTLGPHSAKMLAEHLDITPMGIRQHLQSLEKRELVCYEEARTKVGRPTRYWSLTHEGHSSPMVTILWRRRCWIPPISCLALKRLNSYSVRAKKNFISAMPKSCRKRPVIKPSLPGWCVCGSRMVIWPNCLSIRRAHCWWKTTALSA